MSLDLVVKIDSFVAKKTLSGTPVANSPTVSVPINTSPCICESILAVVVVVFLVAQAVTIKPKIILIDEPSLGLAPSLVEQTFSHIKQIASSGIAVLLVEQNAIKGLQTSGYGVVMDLGKLVFEKPANEVLQDPSLRDLYLGKALKK